MQQGKGKKRTKYQPVFYDELKERRTLSLTPTSWEKLVKLSHNAGISASEYMERLIRGIDGN